MNTAKRWGVALKKNVEPAGKVNKHNHCWPAASFKVFRKFSTRTEARNFQKMWKSPTYIVDLDDGFVVR